MPWFYQSSAQILAYFARQASKDVRLRIDADKLREAITGIYGDNIIQPDPWVFAPGSTTRSDRFNCSRSDCEKLWKDHCSSMGRFIPSIAVARAAQQGENHRMIIIAQYLISGK